MSYDVDKKAGELASQVIEVFSLASRATYLRTALREAHEAGRRAGLEEAAQFVGQPCIEGRSPANIQFGIRALISGGLT